jgi:hypothetical protein
MNVKKMIAWEKALMALHEPSWGESMAGLVKAANEGRICAVCNQEMQPDSIVTETQGPDEGLKVHYSCLRIHKDKVVI